MSGWWMPAAPSWVAAVFELPADNLLKVRDSLAQEVARLVQTTLGQEVRLQQQREGTRTSPPGRSCSRPRSFARTPMPRTRRVTHWTRNRDFAAAEFPAGDRGGARFEWIDPIIARAMVSYRRSRLFGRGGDIHPWIREGIAHIDRALTLDCKNADALELRGNLRYWGWLQGFEPDPEKAKLLLADAQKDLEDATASNPNQAGAWASLTHLYNQTASGTKVALAAQRALEADAFSRTPT
jgi:serine/threonine-protein kinase